MKTRIMDHSWRNFARPVLATAEQVEAPVYTDAQWNNMLGYTYEQPFDATVSKKLYMQANHEVAGSRDIRHLLAKPVPPVHPMPATSLKHEAQHSKEPQPKAIAAMASWCGFSKKAHVDHQKYNANVKTLWCDKGDKQHELCKKTRGFPTYYTPNGQVMNSGYPAQDPKGFYTKLSK